MTQRVDDMRRQRRVQAAAIALKPEQDAACTSPVKSVRRRITQRVHQASRPLHAYRMQLLARPAASTAACEGADVLVLHCVALGAVALWGNAVQS
jgi:hypothetical protein